MSFLRINGWAVGVEEGSASENRLVVGADATSEQAAPIFGRSRPILSWKAQSKPLTQQTADALEGIVCGLGHRFPFDANLFSTRGRGPLSTAGASIVAGGVFGGFCASVTTLVYDLAIGPMPFADRWTVMAFREEAGAFRHYIVRSDGAVFYEGVRDDSVDVSAWLSVFDGFLGVFGAPTRFDELIALAFCADDDQCIAWASRMRDDRIPFSSLPRLDVEGDLFGGRSLEAIGAIDGAERHVGMSNGVALPDGTFWRNNARRVPFTLQQARVAPRLSVPHPLVYFSFEPPYFAGPIDSALPRSTFTTSGALDVVAAQVDDGAGFRGGADAIVDGAAAIPDREDTDPFAISASVRVSPTQPAGSDRSIYAKGTLGVTPTLFFYVTRSASNLCTVGLWMTNAALTAGRRVEASDAFRADEWAHVVATYDGRGDTAGLHLYVNGARVGASVLNTSPGAQANAIAARFGNSGGAGLPLSADLDEVGFWLEHLSSGEVYELFRLASRRQAARFAG